jgi:predicted dehydrogenase
MQNYRAVVVGAGGISKAWFPPLKAEQVDVAGVVDIKQENAEARIKEFGLTAEASTDLKKTLRRCKPDFVVDLTIPESHCQVTLTALKAGYPVVGEKPMASSMAEAKKMVKASLATGKMYMVSQSRRWDPNTSTFHRAISSGQIGAVTSVNCDFYIGAHFGGFRDAMPSPLILDMAIHHFDLVRYFTAADPVSVYAKEFNPRGSWYQGDAAASCIFEMSNGIVFTYRGSWCAEGCHTSWHGNWRVIGDAGTVLFEQDALPRGQKVTATAGFHSTMAPVDVPAVEVEKKGMHGGLCEMLAFLREGKTPQTVCTDNIKSLAMVFAAMESSRKGRKVAISW